VIVATAATVVGLAPAASAAYGPEPVGPSWVPNGGVHAVAVDAAAGRVYVGGAFTGNVAALDAATGRLLWNGNADGDVRALALGPNGTLLVGGAFTTVGGATHRKIAAVNAATGVVNNTFKGTVGGTVRDIVVAGGNAYFAGAFTNHGGMTQQGLGAVNATTGANVTSFTTSANGNVYALGTDGSRLFVGGQFTALGGLARHQLGSITLSTNTVDAWAPIQPCSGCNVIWDLALDNARNRVYTVGRNSGTLFTADKTTGATVFKNVGSVNGDSQAVTLAPNGRVYVGGHFVTIQGQTRMLVAEFDVSGKTPVLGPFSAKFVTSYPGVWALASTGSRLYAGGDFTQAGSLKKFPYFAMFGDASVDATAPTAALSPANGATNVAAATNVTATFSEPVQGVDGSSFTLRQSGAAADVSAIVSYNATTRVATLDPGTDLTAGATYTATLGSAIRDAAGNPLAPTSSTFTITPPPDTTAPTVAGTDPANGSTTAPLTTNVTATFSEPVTGVSGTNFTLTDSTGSAVAATVRQGTGNAWILDPTADLAAGTQYTARLGSGIVDGSGNAFAGGYSWSFATPVTADTTAPTWTGRIPSKDGATAVSATANVTVAFDEEVKNVTTQTFTLVVTGTTTLVPATVTFSTTSGRWVLNPDSTLLANTQYTATVTSGVTDLAGNPFAGMTWSFTTA
jgi:methionine-rich copper-binding protein CopC